MTERILPGARDLQALVDDLEERYIPAFLPEIRDTGGNSVGRRYRGLHAALVDDAHLHVDQAYREGFLATCQELASAIQIAAGIHYNRRGPTGARVTLTFSTIDGAPAPAGGITIPQWTVCATKEAPTLKFLTLSAVSIPEGSTSVTVAAAQGERRTGVLLHAGAPGTPNLEVAIPASQPELELTVVRVDSVTWTRVTSLADSQPTDQHFEVRYDADDTGLLVFGDGEYGFIPPAGAPIEADYVITRGSEGGVPAGYVQKVLGTLATQVVVTNDAASTAGFDGDTLADIKRRAPAALATAWRAVHERDAVELAEGVAGVYRAQGVPEGALLRLYIQGDGGAGAPQSVLDDVLSLIQARKVTGTTVQVSAHTEAEVLISAQIILRDRLVDRAQVRGLVLAALSAPPEGTLSGGPLYWSSAPFGKNLTLTEVARAMATPSGVVEVDITRLTRRPAVTKSNAGAPDIAGLVVKASAVAESVWVLTAIDTTTFQVARDGVLQLLTGTVGVIYTPTGEEIVFTLGSATDSLTAGDTWTFTVSPYRGNVQLSAGEIPVLRASTDADLDIVFSDEV